MVIKLGVIVGVHMIIVLDSVPLPGIISLLIVFSVQLHKAVEGRPGHPVLVLLVPSAKSIHIRPVERLAHHIPDTCGF